MHKLERMFTKRQRRQAWNSVRYHRSEFNQQGRKMIRANRQCGFAIALLLGVPVLWSTLTSWPWAEKALPLELKLIVGSVWPQVYSADPKERMEALKGCSEEVDELKEEWQRVWGPAEHPAGDTSERDKPARLPGSSKLK